MAMETAGGSPGARGGHRTRSLAPRAREKGLEFMLHYPPGVPGEIVADAGRIRQIVLNLAGNALKFTSAGSVLGTRSWSRTIW
jgi:signal transduction histidine kinase